MSKRQITCKDCNELKFHCAKERCRNCYLKYSYNQNPDKFNERIARYKKKYPERIKEQVKKSVLKNKQHYIEKAKEYRQNNRIKILKKNRKWRENNPEKVRLIRQRGDKKYNMNNSIKEKARWHAQYRGFRGKWCLLDLLEGKYVQAMAFHHTDYEANLGFSACSKHHYIADSWLKE